MDKEKMIKTLNMVIEDAENDVKEADGKAFTGHNVAEFNGKQNAMIHALAKSIKEILKDGNI